MTLERDPKLRPGPKAFDGGRKHVFRGGRDTHFEDRSRQEQVRRLAAGPVNGGGLDGEVVDDLLGHFVSCWAGGECYAPVGSNPPLDAGCGCSKSFRLKS